MNTIVQFSIIVGFICLVVVIVKIFLKKKLQCTICKSKMTMVLGLDRVKHLRSSEEKEEHIQSVSYAIWKCSCGAVEKQAKDQQSKYFNCPQCAAKAYSIQQNQVTAYPVYLTSGHGTHTYQCCNCNYTDQQNYTIYLNEGGLQSMHIPQCSRCHIKMTKLSDIEKTSYLHPSQGKEDRLKSIAYDVWRCTCNNLQMLSYNNKTSQYTKCYHCKIKAYILKSDTIRTPPTNITKGKGVRIFNCRYCNHLDMMNM